jgi:serine/threonine protein kinase
MTLHKVIGVEGKVYNVDSHLNLSRGATSAVYVAYEVQLDTKLYAIKVACGTSPESRRSAVNREVEMLKHTASEYVIQLIDYNLSLERPFLITELLPCTLQDLLETKSLSNELFWGFVQEIPRMLETLQERNVVHRDINARNIVYDGRKKRFKLLDFASALPHIHEGTLGMAAPTLKHPAFPPEFAEGFVSQASDVYMFGRTLEYLLTGEISEEPGMYWNDEKNIFGPDVWEFLDTVESMVHTDYHRRPSNQQLNERLRGLSNSQWPSLDLVYPATGAYLELIHSRS